MFLAYWDGLRKDVLSEESQNAYLIIKKYTDTDKSKLNKSKSDGPTTTV